MLACKRPVNHSLLLVLAQRATLNDWTAVVVSANKQATKMSAHKMDIYS